MTKTRWINRLTGALYLSVMTSMLASCGGGSVSGGSEQTQSLEAEIPSSTVQHATANAYTSDSGIRVAGISKARETRVSRTIYDYEFRVEVQNSTRDQYANITAQVSGVGIGTTVIDGTARLDELSASSSSSASDTIVLRHDRTQPFDVKAIKWNVRGAKVTSPPPSRIEVVSAKVKSDILDATAVLDPSIQSGVFLTQSISGLKIGQIFLHNGSTRKITSMIAQKSGGFSVSSETVHFSQAFDDLAFKATIHPLFFSSNGTTARQNIPSEMKRALGADVDDDLRSIFRYGCIVPVSKIEAAPEKFGYAAKISCNLGQLLGREDLSILTAIRIDGSFEQAWKTVYHFDLGRRDDFVEDSKTISYGLTITGTAGDALRRYIETNSGFCRNRNGEVNCKIPITNLYEKQKVLFLPTTPPTAIPVVVKLDMVLEFTLRGEVGIQVDHKSSETKIIGRKNGEKVHTINDPAVNLSKFDTLPNWVRGQAVAELAFGFEGDVALGAVTRHDFSAVSIGSMLAGYGRLELLPLNTAGALCKAWDVGYKFSVGATVLKIEELGLPGFEIASFEYHKPVIKTDYPGGCSDTVEGRRVKIDYLIAGRDYYTYNTEGSLQDRDTYDVSGSWLLEKGSSSIPYFLLDLKNTVSSNPSKSDLRYEARIVFAYSGARPSIESEVKTDSSGTNYQTYKIFPGKTNPGEAMTVGISAYVAGKREKTETYREIKLQFEPTLAATPKYRYYMDEVGIDHYVAAFNFGTDTQARIKGGYVLMSNGTKTYLDQARGLDANGAAYTYFESEKWVATEVQNSIAIVPVELILESKATFGKPGAYRFPFVRNDEIKINNPLTITPNSIVIGNVLRIQLSGTNIPADVGLSVPGCNGLEEVRSNASIRAGIPSTEYREFKCTAIEIRNDIQVTAVGGIGSGSYSIVQNTDLPQIVAHPVNSSIGDLVEFYLANASKVFGLATKVVWDFGAGILSKSADLVDKIYQAFAEAGEKIISATFLNNRNHVVGQVSTTIAIGSNGAVSGTAQILSIRTATGEAIPEGGATLESKPTLSGTLNAPISNYFSVWVYLDDVRLAQATVDGISWTYTATSDIPVGLHRFTVAVVRFDGVEGAQSAPRSLTILGSSADASLIAHFPFDGSLADRVRPGPAGRLAPQGTPPLFESGNNGQAVQLTPPSAAPGSYLRGEPLVTTDTAFTIVATVKPNGISANWVNALVYQRTDLGGEAAGCAGNAYNFGLAIYLGRWMFQVSTLQGGACIHATIYAPIQPVVGRYYRVAGVYDKSAGKARLYVDGLLVGEQAAGSSFRITPNMVTTVGNQPWASPPQPANASIDDLRVYTRALTPAELPKDQWNAFNDYSLLANPSGPWRYAFQAAESGISPMTAAAANCGDLGLSCWKRSADSVGLPMVAINSSDAVHRNRTLVIPPNMLVLHPGIAEERAVIEFSAPADGRYKFTGRWEIVDTNPSGVKLTWAGPRGTGASTLLNGYAATSPISVSLNLLAGEKVSFSVDANGNYGNDSTGLVLQVTNQGTADPALVGYWSFDDCTAADNSGSGGNGLLVGSPVCEQGVAGSGMKLNSTNWIDVPSRPSLEFTSSFTISVWFKADALTTEKSVRLVDKTAAGLSDGYLLSVWASGLSLVGGPNGAVSDLTTISSNVFHHAVVTFGNGIANFYLDGKPIGSRSVGAMSVTVNADRVLRIGASQGPAAHPTLNNFVGVIDEVRLYNTTLSSSDVSDLYRVTSKIGASSGSITILANTIPGSMLTVPAGVSSCAFTSTGTWSAGPNAPPQYQNADGVIGTTSYNLTDFGVPIPSAPNMALVVQHSSTGKWDLLGSSKTISVQAGETLSFMMNDATTFGYADGNTGQLSTIWTCN